MAYAALTSRAIIGLVFAVSAFSKLRSFTAYREFASWLADVPVPLAANRALPSLLAAAESAIVVLVAVPATALAGLVLAGFTLAVLTAGTAVAVGRGARMTCQCFGPSRTVLAGRHVMRNGFLIAMAVTGAFGASLTVPQSAGVALSLWAAVALATFVVFMDDLVFLAGGDAAASAGAGRADSKGEAVLS
jgi:hypothetical protein